MLSKISAANFEIEADALLLGSLAPPTMAGVGAVPKPYAALFASSWGEWGGKARAAAAGSAGDREVHVLRDRAVPEVLNVDLRASRYGGLH